MKRIMQLAARASAGLLALIALLTFCDVIGRYILAKNLPGGYDLGQQLQAIVIFWGMALATYGRAHISVDVLWENHSPKAQKLMDKFSDIVCAIAFAALFICTSMQIPKMLRSSEIIPDLGIPIWAFTCVATAGALFAAMGAVFASAVVQEDGAGVQGEHP